MYYKDKTPESSSPLPQLQFEEVTLFFPETGIFLGPVGLKATYRILLDARLQLRYRDCGSNCFFGYCPRGF